jgi:DNA/RNA-binding domain of Phe-tRNA-synthetase-like protein
MWVLSRSLPLRLALAEMRDVHIPKHSPASDHLKTCAKHYRETVKGQTIAQISGVQNARKLFRAIGMDPTHRRPSSEALLRRALKNKSMPSINPLVDIGNWCSLEFLLPICIYDADAIVGTVRLEIGTAHDQYKALNGELLNVDGRFILSDDHGPFGSPITDSVRTAVTPETRHILPGIFAPDDYPASDLTQKLDVFIQRIKQICGGVCIRRDISDDTKEHHQHGE